jgi:hypothetical protein
MSTPGRVAPLEEPGRGTTAVGSVRPPPRIALYSPGMVGLDPMRRNLLIAQARSSLRAVILLVAEAREAGGFAMPPGCDCLTLPALRKDEDGQCRPRHLGVGLPELIALRAKSSRDDPWRRREMPGAATGGGSRAGARRSTRPHRATAVPRAQEEHR